MLFLPLLSEASNRLAMSMITVVIMVSTSNAPVVDTAPDTAGGIKRRQSVCVGVSARPR